MPHRLSYALGLLLLTSLNGCSWQAQPPPLAQQRYDLLDMDGDGVINQRDNCASTLSGAQVSNEGCPSALTRTTLTPAVILFDNDQDVIRPNQQATIRTAIRKLKNDPAMMVTLVGHTSSTASDQYNLALSQRRVQAVEQALRQAGIASNRISDDYRGERELKYQGEQELAHSHNRRVEIRYHSKVTQSVMRWHIYSVDRL
ncbi:OmpA family protein [uncultured Ferrimonas sp.]|uniref:OmpA family protein n=1 Tax=uncultured Ferrimonas sp. TaxID=432640 RepID=UPI00262EDC96|nr:OmpA family protein [uncultured Ferrimonas sp.]